MLCPCSLIILAKHTKSQMEALGFISVGRLETYGGWDISARMSKEKSEFPIVLPGKFPECSRFLPN